MFYPSQDIPSEIREEYKHVIEYVHGFLKQKHPFRMGAICPHIAHAERSRSIHYMLVRSKRTKQIREALEIALLYHAKENATGATIMLFPRKVWLGRLKKVRDEHLSQAHRNGVLLGLLHPYDRSESKYGQDFFPLRSPAPIITIRSMILSDVDIIVDPVWNDEIRKDMLHGYIQRFQDSTDHRIQERVTTARDMTG